MADAAREVACAYAVTVDGFIAVAARAIRNPESPFIVWMPAAVWQRLAICATTQGQFYMPCQEELRECSQLRGLISALEEETTNGNS